MSKKQTQAELLSELRTKTKERNQVGAARSETKALGKEVERLERVLDHTLNLDKAWKSLDVVAPTRHRGKQRPATFVALASDWHVGELVDPAKVQGLNAYNTNIANFRANRFFQAIAFLIEQHRKAQFDIRHLVLVVNGDMITGWIHEEMLNSNPSGPVLESLMFERLFSAGLEFLAKTLEGIKIHVVCQIGNHGRFTAKTMVSMAAHCSFEWLSYHHLQSRHPECSWQIEDGRHSVFTVYGMRMHVHHGDTVRSQGGIGGILVPLNRAAAFWREKYKAKHTMVGHFHQLLQTPTLTVNGSLIGYSSYADSLPGAQPEPAQQASFLIDAKRGMCHSTPLWVSDPSEEKRNGWWTK